MVTMSTVWDRTTEFLSDNLGAVMPIAILTLFLPISVQASLGAGPPPAAASARIALGVAQLLLSLVHFWGGLAITALVLDRAARWGEALAVAGRRMPAAVLTSLLLLLGVAILFAPMIAAGVLASGAASAADPYHLNMRPHGAVAGVMLLYSLVVLLVLLWVGARLSVWTGALIAEDRGPSALQRSFVLTRGLALRIIGVVILFLIVFFVATLAVQTVFGSVLQLVAPARGTLSLATVLTAVLVAAVQTGFTVLAYAFTARLYVAVRDKSGAIAGAI